MSAITDYADLKTKVADLLNRADLTSQIPLFIGLAEAAFNRTLRTVDQQNATTLELTDTIATLPTDFVELISVTVPESPSRPLQYVTPAEFNAINYANYSTGPALGYTIRGSQLHLAPGAGTVTQLAIVYYEKIESLSNSATTNWLLLKWPDLYLYGAAMHAAIYLRDAEMLETFKAAHDLIMSEIDFADRSAKYNGSPLVMRARSMG